MTKMEAFLEETVLDLGIQLTGACVRRRVAGWVAGGCWDHEIHSYYGSFPKIPYV